MAMNPPTPTPIQDASHLASQGCVDRAAHVALIEPMSRPSPLKIVAWLAVWLVRELVGRLVGGVRVRLCSPLRGAAVRSAVRPLREVAVRSGARGGERHELLALGRREDAADTP